MRRFSLILVALVAATAGGRAGEDGDWRSRLSSRWGDWPDLPAVKMVFRFGWANVLDAGTAEATIGPAGSGAAVRVTGGTTGLARALWRLDARHESFLPYRASAGTRIEQTERYRNRTIETKVRIDATGIDRWRQVSSDTKAARWKRVDFTPVFDVVGGGLFVRSQSLAPGQTIRLVCFPGDAPYLVTLRVEGRETLRVMSRDWPAIRLSLQVQRLEVKKRRPQNPVAYGKFRSGTVWLSDDALRLPLRAEVNVMIGFVYGELSGFTRL